MEPVLSNKFSLEDIRTLRDYNSLRHLTMSASEIIAERRKSTEAFLKEMAERKEKSIKA